MEPSRRYLVRRFFAFVVDWWIAALIAALLFWPFMMGTGTDKLRLDSSAFQLNRCWTGSHITPELADMLTGETPIGVKYCETKKFFFISNGLTAHVALQPQTKPQNKNVKYSKIFEVPVDKDGAPVSPDSLDLFVVLAIMIAGNAWWATNHRGKTLGKSLLGLRVLPAERTTLLRREMIKMFPVVVIAFALGFIFALTPLGDIMMGKTAGELFEVVTSAGFWVIVIALAAVFVWYYLWPLFTGTKQLRHDRIAGTKVIRD